MNSDSPSNSYIARQLTRQDQFLVYNVLTSLAKFNHDLRFVYLHFYGGMTECSKTCLRLAVAFSNLFAIHNLLCLTQ